MRDDPFARDFEVAMVWLRAGQAVARRSWAEARGPADLLPPAYIRIEEGRRLTGVWRGPPISRRECRLSGEDLLGTDWRLIPPSERLAGERKPGVPGFRPDVRGRNGC